MASYNPPVKNAEYIFYISLFAQSDNQIKTTPTLASGDFKVSTDGGATSNLDTLPSESPAASGNVKVTVSATEMNGDNVSVIWKDAAGDEWHSGMANIQPVASGQQFDDLSTVTASDVNAQVLDVLNVDTFVEPSGAPAATATLVAKIGWLAALARNKITQTASTQTLRNDADDGNIATSAVSDDGSTFTRAEWS